VLWVWGFYAQLGVPVWESDWTYARFAFKKARAESIKEPKLIVTSGSNGLYGVGADRIEEELGVPTVNMAVNAGLGLKYILRQTQSVVQSGDWILAPLEYGFYGEKDEGEIPTGYCNSYVLAHDPDYFRAQGLTQKAKCIASIGTWRFFEGLLRAVFRSLALKEGSSPMSLNRNGDTTDNVGQEFDGVTDALENFLLQKEGPSEAALRTLSGFIDECEQNGVRFFAAYPSLFYDNAYLSETAREKIAAIEAFYASKNVPVLGTFEDSLHPIEDMYDTCYHLNAVGREKRTRQMVELLKPYIPAKPESPR
jgi:hypothetical protein